MILNEFFNLPQVFEKNMTENEKTLAIGQQMAQDGIVYDHTKEDQLIGIMGEYMERNGMTPKQIRYYLSYDEDFVPDQLSYLPKNGDDAETFVQSEYVPRGREEEMDEGIFGSRPSPVLPIVDKINKVARGLTPQNVEVGKQIIQANARDITRMLSPQDKAGVDVIEQGMAEGTGQGREIRNKKGTLLGTWDGRTFTMDPGLEQRWTEDNGPEWIEAFKNKKTQELQQQSAPSQDSIKYYANELEKSDVQSGQPRQSRQQYYDLAVQLLSGQQGVVEAKDDYVPPKEANYDDKYQAMVRRVGQKAKAQEKAKQQPPKAPVRESRLALLKQIIQS
tara:strand:+ start:47 stop:1048 length:1002 start_codon:yes stop_codon:yes gene_type:complete